MKKDMELPERIEKLESHVAHLERQLEQLNEVAIDHAREIEQLKRLLNRVSQSIEAAELDRIKSVDSKPPHYQ